MASQSHLMYGPKTPPGRDYEGLFATKDIKEGSRLFSEAALFASEHLRPIDINYMVRGLREQDREAYLSLRHFGYLDLAAQEEDLEELRPLVQDGDSFDLPRPVLKRHVYEKTLMLITSDPVTRKPSYNELEISYGAKSVAIFKVNSFRIRNTADTGDRDGIFLAAAHIKHSCVPNCCVSWHPVGHKLCLHASRNINAGEELCISYEADLLAFENREQRRARLQTTGLVCDCTACDSSTEYGQRHEAIRKRVAGVREQLAQAYASNPVPGSRRLRDLYCDLVSLLLHEQPQTTTWGVGRVYVTIAMLSLEISDLDFAEKSLRPARDFAQTCFGDDHPTAMWLRSEHLRVAAHLHAAYHGGIHIDTTLTPAELRAMYDTHGDTVR